MKGYRQELRELNPKFKNIEQICEDNWIRELDNKGYRSYKYNNYNSFLYSATSENILISDEENGDKIICYKIVFTTIGKRRGLLDPKLLFYTADYLGTSSDVDIEFFSDFFVNTLEDLDYIDCHGSKCRRSINPRDNSIWCTACYGELEDSAYLFRKLMYDSIYFNDIPKKSIVIVNKIEI